MKIILPTHDSMATPAQIKYIEQLAIDLQFPRHVRNAHVSDIIKHKVKFLDELSKREATTVIIKFREWKEQGKTFDA